MTGSMHNSISRSVSQTMFIACIILTSAILFVLVLVAGYLVFSGFGQLGVHLFTHLPNDEPPA